VDKSTENDLFTVIIWFTEFLLPTFLPLYCDWSLKPL